MVHQISNEALKQIRSWFIFNCLRIYLDASLIFLEAFKKTIEFLAIVVAITKFGLIISGQLPVCIKPSIANFTDLI
jgi:hypothetical protein